MQTVDHSLRRQRVSSAADPGLTIRVQGPEGAHYVVRGPREKRTVVEQRGVPAGRIWTLREIESLEGVLWPANPTLGQVLEALAGPAGAGLL